VEISTPRPPLFHLGRGALIFGIVNLVRLIAERVMVGSGSKGTYTLVLTGDILLSVLLIVGGRGLLKERPGRRRRSCFRRARCSSAPSCSSSGCGRISESRGPGASGCPATSSWAPRLLFYAFLVLACPYAAVTLVRRREAAWPSRGRLVGWLIGGAAAAARSSPILIARHWT
jgi:hypothetical protein